MSTKTGPVIVMREDHLGDMILTTPLVRELAAAGYTAIVVGPAAWADVWQGNPNARYVPLNRIAPGWPSGLFQLAGWLKKQAPKAILVPHHSRRLLVSAALSGRTRYCQLGRWWGRLTRHHCLRTRINETPRHMGLVWQDLLPQLGLERGPAQPELFVESAESEALLQRLRDVLPVEGPLVVVHPFDGGSACNLPLSRFAAIVEHLCNLGARVVVTGVAAEEARWSQAAAEGSRAWNACGSLTLRELFALVSLSRFVVVGNTGPLHVAHALRVPSISVFCPQSTIGRALWANLTPGSRVLSPEAADCPRLRGDVRTLCTIDHTPEESTIMATLEAALADAEQPT